MANNDMVNGMMDGETWVEEQVMINCSPVEQLMYDFQEQKTYTNLTDYLLARLVVATENINDCAEEDSFRKECRDAGIDPIAARKRD